VLFQESIYAIGGKKSTGQYYADAWYRGGLLGGMMRKMMMIMMVVIMMVMMHDFKREMVHEMVSSCCICVVYS